jgi:hypothetical protein
MIRVRLQLVCFMSLLFLSLQAQIPDGIHYQAVLRNEAGEALANKSVNIRSTVLRSATNSIVYRETMLSSTNEFGLLSLVLGKGNEITGRFRDIEWEAGGLKIRIEVDPDGGSFFRPFGETDLQTVPYSFASQTALTVQPSARINPSQINGGGASVGQILKWNGSSWAPTTESGSSSVSVTARLSGNGSTGSPLDIARQGALTGQVLKWNGSSWAPADESGTVYNEGAGIIIENNVISATTNQAIWNAAQLRGRNVSSTAPQSGQFLLWDGFNWSPTTVQTGLVLPYDGSNNNGAMPAFRVTNTEGAGINGRGIIGVRATYFGSGAGTALEIQNGGIRVIGSNKPAFQVSGSGNIVINSPLANANPTALVYATQINPNPAVNQGQYPFSISYNFVDQMWYIISDPDVSLGYNIFIINQL